MADTDTLTEPVYPEVASTPGMPTPPPITFGDPTYWQSRTVTTRTKDDTVEPEPTIPPQEVQLGAVGRGPLLPGQGAALLQRSMTPEQFQAQMARLTSIGERQTDIGQQQSRLVQDYEARRAPLEAQARRAFQSYTQALEQPRPEPPELQKMPEKPDLTPRPWLDPEGGNALRVIAQGIGALAVGVSGLAVGAPKTMLRYFRESLEDWQLDQHERGMAKWHEFQGELERVRGDNADALKVYELLDRQWGTNVEAKRAAAIAQLDALGLEDQALRAASLPYERQREALDGEARTIGQTITASNNYDRVNAEYLKAMGKAAPDAKTLDQMILARSRTTDPVEQRALDDAISRIQQFRLKYAGALAQARSDQGVVAKEVTKLDAGLLQADQLEVGLKGLLEDYATLQKGGKLRDSPSMVSGWMAGIRRQFGSDWTPEEQEALNRIQHFYPRKIVAFERATGDIGARVKAAFGPLEDALVSYSQAKGIIRGISGEIDTLRSIYREQRGRLQTSVPAPGGMPESEAEEE